jgi:hypothetical protein
MALEPVYLDLHIHTSVDADSLNEHYDVPTLKQKIEEVAEGSPCLISLTDHNTINKTVYLEALETFDHLLLGAELHVMNYDDAPPYHCHIYFRVDAIDEPTIDSINTTLDKLYPKKMVSKKDDDIPNIAKIVNSFDDFEFVLLPHGGQSHSTFDESIPAGTRFDTTMERSVYYNYFDGFSARGNKGLEDTLNYFNRLGIREFVNLITSTDNYRPTCYPQSDYPKAPDFVPTWMLASPTFSGLRLSLSESDRLRYGVKPDSWSECIQDVALLNDMIDIDVTLTPGLNVVIGGSSSGKTLLVDSIYRSVSGSFSDSLYVETYGVQDIQVHNPAGQTPHYLAQNYIVSVCDSRDRQNKIEDIPILKSVFPPDADEREMIDNGLNQLSKSLGTLVEAVESIESLEEQLAHIRKLSGLILTEPVRRNPLGRMLPDDEVIEALKYTPAMHERHERTLDEIETLLAENPLVDHDPSLVEQLKSELEQAQDASEFEAEIRAIITSHYDQIAAANRADNYENDVKRRDFGNLRQYIKRYKASRDAFYSSLKEIAEFSLRVPTKEIVSMGHRLSIENRLVLTKDTFLDVVNETRTKGMQITSFEAIAPHALFSQNFRQSGPKIDSLQAFKAYVTNRFNSMNTKLYRIVTSDGRDFEALSAGWKTAVILDLVLGCSADTAPLIIDQPEDNLATHYINSGLLTAIKGCKKEKQVILVSHNATIPMLGDAQNVIMCRNNSNRIVIRSGPLEGTIDGRDIVDLIAATTDGGKASIKKRVKKYNLKKFGSDDEADI